MKSRIYERICGSDGDGNKVHSRDLQDDAAACKPKSRMRESHESGNFEINEYKFIVWKGSAVLRELVGVRRERRFARLP